MSDETASSEEIPVEFRRHWLLEPGTTYLNHGAFGGCPKRVLRRQSELRTQFERQPTRFFEREIVGLIDHARAELASFVGTDTEGLAFVPNATTGINAVLRSRDFDPGDEILVTDQAYRACRNAVDFVAERADADVTVAEVPFPAEDPDEIVDAILQATTPRTDLALLEHVASDTGLVWPVEQLCRELDARHVDTLVDGAHAPGMIDLDVAALECTYYTGNCHKWLCAPKGAAFLWVEPHEREDIHPTTISNGFGEEREDRSSYHMEFDWTGTSDPTPYLCVPEAIDFLGELVPDGWAGLREHNHAFAVEARRRLCDLLDIEPPAPDAMIGSLAAVPLPDRDPDEELDDFGRDRLTRRLSEEHGIEVPIKTWPESPQRLLRVSAQIYNTQEDLDRLVDALDSELNL
jgi:isopenicillin-N epimerase